MVALVCGPQTAGKFPLTERVAEMRALIIARSRREAVDLAKHLGLAPRHYTYPATARSIVGLTFGDVFVDASTDRRPDRHAIRAALKNQVLRRYGAPTNVYEVPADYADWKPGKGVVRSGKQDPEA